MGLAITCKQAPKHERGLDLYESPTEAVHALLEHEDVPRAVWEPACGPGAIVRVLRASGRAVHATDLGDWGCPDSIARVDFLMELRAPVGITAIVTNPPYMIANRFIHHACALVPRVYMLLPLQFLEGGQKSELRRQLLDGGDLARVLLFSKRLPMMHRHGWTGKRAPSARPYAWFVWERGHQGPITIKRIAWRPLGVEVTKVKAA
jgi:hypothetical protein